MPHRWGQTAAGNRSGYVGTATIEDVDSAQFIQLIGTNPWDEAPVLNARIRKAWANGANIGLVGEAVDLTYDYAHVGTDRAALNSLRKEYGAVNDAPSVAIVGQGALREADGSAVLGAAMLGGETNSKLMVLHTAAGRVGAMDVNAVNENDMDGVNAAEVIYNLGADEIEIGEGFVIYQGSHGIAAHIVRDVILPAAAYTEENGLFVNTEGAHSLPCVQGLHQARPRKTGRSCAPCQRELDATLPYDSLAQLRQAMVAAHPHLAKC